MSRTVDERVVSMQFDNRHFEQNVQTSLNTLDKLKNSLNFKGASKGLENVRGATQKVAGSFEEMEYAAYQSGFHMSDVWKKFSSVLEYQIAGRIINVGKKMISALTIDPIKTGFNEYETQLNAVQTILANTESKGKTLDDVNGALDELNTYADKTIYNFTEMTRNIGTFTAAGVDLDTSVAAIKGIANLAAVSGSTSQQASTAMYQLSQAMASGTVKLMDWNSVVNAGMGGQIFQDALKETAKVHGIAIDDIIKKQGSFRESLSEGWLTTEILTETLSKFTGDLSEEQLKSMGYTQEQIKEIMKLGQTASDAATKVKTFTQLFDTLKEAAQSGWAQTWEIVIGDFEEAKEFFTELSDTLGGIIGASAESRNKLLSTWKDLGGRTHLIESIRNIFQSVISIAKPIKDAFSNMFPPMTAEKLFSITEGIKKFTFSIRSFIDDHSTEIQKTFEGIFAVLSIGANIISAVWKAFKSLFGVTGKVGGGILGITAAIGDFLVIFAHLVKESNIFQAIFTVIGRIIKSVIGFIGDLVISIKNGFTTGPLEGFRSFVESISDRFKSLGKSGSDAGDKIQSVFETIGTTVANSPIVKFLKTVWNSIKKVASSVGSVFKSLFKDIGNSFSSVDGIQSLLDIVNSIIKGGIGVYLIKFIKSLTGSFGGGEAGILSKLGETLDAVKDSFERIQQSLNAKLISTIAKSILILVASLLVLAFIPEDKLYSALAAITALLVGIGIAFKVMMGTMSGMKSIKKTSFTLKDGLQSVTDGYDFKGMASAIKSLTSIAIALLIMAATLKLLSTMTWKEIGIGLAAMGVMLAMLVITLKSIAKCQKTATEATDGAKKLVKLALVLLLLVPPFLLISMITWNAVRKGLHAMSGAFGILVSTLIIISKIKSKTKMATEGAMELIKLSGALLIASASLFVISLITWNGVRKGLHAMAGVFGTLTAVIVLLSNTKANKMAQNGALELIKLSTILLIASASLLALSLISWNGVIKGLTAISGVFRILKRMMKKLSKTDDTKMAQKGAWELIKLSTALLIASASLLALSLISWNGVLKSLAAMSGAFGILTRVMKKMSKMDNSGKGALAIIGAASALLILATAFLVLSVVPILSIVASLIAIAAVFGILAAAGYLLAPVAPVILMLAKSLLAIGAAVFLAGAGLALFALALAASASGLIALYGAILIVSGALGTIGKAITVLVSAFIVGIIEGIGKGIIALCKVIAEGAVAIGETIKVVILTVLDLIIELIPQIVDVVLELLLKVLQALAQKIGPIVEALLDLCIGIINAVAKKMQPLVKACVDLLFSFIEAVISSLSGLDANGLEKALLATTALTIIMAELAAMAYLAPSAMIGVLGMAAVIGELSIALAAIGALSQIPGLKWLVEKGGDFLETVGVAIGKFVGGIIGGIGLGITGTLPEMANDLSDFMKNLQPFIDGANLIKPETLNGVKNLIGIIAAISAANILETLTTIFTGGSSVVKFGIELCVLGYSLSNFSESVKDVNEDNVNKAVDAAKALAEMTSHIPNTGGLAAWFVGENSILNFADDLPYLGTKLEKFSDNVDGIIPDNITAASNAAKALAEMVSFIPNTGGITAWFTGENSVVNFADDLPKLALGLKNFSVNLGTNFNADAVTAAAGAAKALAEMTDSIPNTGGVKAWFVGENNMADFADRLPDLGSNLMGFATNVDGINPEAVTAAAGAAKALAEMTNSIPNTGGVKAWFVGENNMADFADKLPDLGSNLMGFATNVDGINPEAVTAAANAAKALAEMTDTVPKKSNKIIDFGKNLVSFAEKLKEYFNKTKDITADSATTASKVIESVKEIANIDSDNIKSLAEAIDELTKAIKDMTSGITTDLKTAGIEAIEAFTKSINDGLEGVKTACENIVNGSIKIFKDSSLEFKTVGQNVVAGFAEGINANTYMAEAKARAMAAAAAEAARKELDEHSPSKVGYKIGDYFGIAFVNAISDNESKAYKASSEMAKSAKSGLSKAISNITDLINSDIDTQPTIRPVLDLSDVKSGANSINNMLGLGASVGVMSNVNAIGSMMAKRSQNGANDDIISSIDKLRKDLSNISGDTYNINGVTYDDGSNIAEAIKTIIDAARVERRR